MADASDVFGPNCTLRARGATRQQRRRTANPNADRKSHRCSTGCHPGTGARWAVLAASVAAWAGGLLHPGSALAEVRHWTGGTSTWAGAGNWTPGGVPDPIDTVIIDQGNFTATYDADMGYSVVTEVVLEARMTLSLTGGTLSITGTGDSLFGGGLGSYGNTRYIQTGGTLESGEGIIVSGTSRFTLSGGMITGIHGQTVGPGSIYLQNGGTNQLSMLLSGATGTLELGSLGNGTNSSFNVQNLAGMTQYDGSVMMASMRVDGASRYDLNGGTINTGSMNIGHVGINPNDHAVGTVTHSAGTVSVAQNLRVAEGHYLLQGGSLSVGGTLIVGPPAFNAFCMFEQTAGTLGAATITTATGAVFRYAGGAHAFSLMTNAGELRVSNGASFSIGPAASVTNTGSVQFDSDSSITGTGTLANGAGGRITKTGGTGTTSIASTLAFTGSGTIDMIAATSIDSTGPVYASAGAVTTKNGAGTLRFGGATQDWQAGSGLVLNAGTTLLDTDLGAGTARPNITLNAATLSVSTLVSLGDFSLTTASSYAGGAGTISVGGTFQQPDGLIESNLLIAGPGTFSGGTIGNGSTQLRILTGGALAQTAGLVTTQRVAVDGAGAYAMSGGSITTPTLSVDGGGSFALSAGAVSTVTTYVGPTSGGTFIHSGGSHLASDYLSLGEQLGGSGTYVFSGAVTVLSTNELDVGYAGNGYMSHADGTISIGSFLALGTVAGGSGSYSMSSGATLLTPNAYVGLTGSGSFGQSSGTATFGTLLSIGELPGSNGTYSISGTSVVSAPEFDVGFQGNGTVIQNGGSVSAPYLNLGARDPVIGTASGYYALIDGTVTSDDLIVGIDPRTMGTFVQTGGSASVSTDLSIAYYSGSAGTYSLGGGSLSANRVQVGGSTEGMGGAGTMSVSAGSLGVAQTLLVYGGGNVRQSGGEVTADRIDVLGGNVQQNGGTTVTPRIAVESSGAYGVGGGTLSTSSLSIDGGSSFTSSGGTLQTATTFIGPTGSGTFVHSGGLHSAAQFVSLGDGASGSGTYQLSGSGELSTNELDVGYGGTGYVAQSGGTVSIGSFLALGVIAGGRGTYEMSAPGGLITSPNVYAGLTGEGTFSQLAGTINVGSVLSVGELPGSNGTYTIGAGALLTAAELDVAFQGNGTFMHNGGTVSTANLYVGARDPVAGTATGLYQMGGGILSVGPELIVGVDPQTVGRFEQSGGTANVGGDLSIGYYTGSTGTLTLGGGTLVAGALQVAGSPGSAGGAGMLVVQGSGNLSVPNTLKVWTGGVIQYNGGEFFASTLDITAGGSMSVGAGSAVTVRVNSLSIDPTTRMDLSDSDMIVEYTGTSPMGDLVTPGTIAYYIATARDSGTWAGTHGITSSLGDATLYSLGYAEASDVYGIGGAGTATFNGYTVDASTVLVKYTYYGDADLTGAVDFDDYVRIDFGYNVNLTGWLNGDFDYSGIIDFDDYVLIDLAFNTQGGTLRLAMDYLSGDDRNRDRMNTPELRKVVEHFDAFGTPYALNFLSAAPEPSGGLVCSGLVLGALSRRRRARR